VFVDYSQIELRLLAWYLTLVGDESMAIAFREDRDLHAETAKGIFDIRDREPTPDERAVGKTLNFAVVYQGGVPTVKKLLDVKAPVANDYLTKFHETWPYIGRHRYCKCYVDYCPQHDPAPGTLAYILREARHDRGYAKTLIGRKVKPDSDHKIMSAVIQGGAAEIMKEAMLTSDAALKGSGMETHLVSTIHDELMFDTTHKEFSTLCELVPGWMDYPTVSDTVPITIDIEYSDVSWADKETYER
jgi:DNA polymerase-1